MLDSGRQYQKIETIKKYIDLMSLLKMNYFHWHLTEGLGWRIEIKRYPKLTSIGSNVARGKEQQGYYSQAEVKELIIYAKERGITFSTPTEIVTKLKSVDQIDVPYPMSWTDEERDISPWLGNVMQREAFNKLYSVAERVHLCNDRRIKQDWDYLQASNNFRFMTSKDTGISINRGIYDSPYDAFTNYMNILGDFISRVNSLYPVDMDNEELNSLLTTIKNQGEELVALNKEVERLQAKLAKAEAKIAAEAEKTPSKKAVAKKPAAKKAPAKKAAPKKEE